MNIYLLQHDIFTLLNTGVNKLILKIEKIQPYFFEQMLYFQGETYVITLKPEAKYSEDPIVKKIAEHGELMYELIILREPVDYFESFNRRITSLKPTSQIKYIGLQTRTGI